MGRLAQTFAGLQIMDMIPYAMKTELTLNPSTSSTAFPNADLLNTGDKPFAVHRVIPRIIALDTNGLVLATQPDLETREALVSVSLMVTGVNQPMTKEDNPIYIGNLVGGSTSERYWRLEEPIVMPNANGINAKATVSAFPAGVTYTTLRVTLVLEGYILVVAPPKG